MGDISKLRSEINDIDKKLINLFEERMEVVSKIAEQKKMNNISILNKNREIEVIEKNTSYLKNKNLKNEAEEFFRSLMSISRKFQSKELYDYSELDDNPSYNLEYEINKSIYEFIDETVIVGFQGVQGSFSEQALIEYFGERNKTYSFKEFQGVFEALKNNEIDYGVLPIENSSTGSIADIYDLLRKYGLYIVGELCIKVEHNLLGVKGTKIKDIEEVYSHIQGFRQSCEFFKEYCDWKLIPYRNTAASAEYVSKLGDKSKAAVASKKAAEVYDLEIIKSNINYNSNNYTRFVVIGNDLEINKESNKISILLSLPHKVGSLHNILMLFAENNLNMLKIESRPIVDKSWEYFFYIDFEGNLEDGSVKNLLKAIEKKSTYFKLLGNYKCFCS